MTQQLYVLPKFEEFDPTDFKTSYNSGYLYKNFYSGIKVQKLGDIKYPGRGKPLTFKARNGAKEGSCGMLSKTYSCGCHSTIVPIQHTCYKMTCPICYQKGIHRSSERIAERFKKIKKMFKRAEIPFQLFHISFNTQWLINDYDSFRKYKKKIITILKKERLHGYIIFHGWRKRTKARGKFVRWKTIPNRTKLVKSKSTRLLRAFQNDGTPQSHFHFLGVGRPVFSPIFHKKYGFTYTNITYKNYMDGKAPKPFIRSIKQVRNLTSYLLSHAGIVRGKHTITWFNQFSYNRLSRINETLLKKEIECEECGSFLYPISRNPIKFEGNFYDGFTWYYPFHITRNLSKPLIEKYEKYDIHYKGNMNIFQKIYIYDKQYLIQLNLKEID